MILAARRWSFLTAFSLSLPFSVTAQSAWLHLPLDEGVGNSTVDTVGTNHGTLSGAVWSADAISGGWSVEFDGSDDRIALPAFDLGGHELTISLWFKADDFDVGDGRLISKASGIAEQDHWWMLSTIKTGGETRLRTRIRTTSGTSTLIANTGALDPGVWYHAAVTYDGSDIRLYLDGAPVGSKSKSGILAQNTSIDVAIGHQPSGAGAKPFDGRIDELLIFDHALDQAGVLELAAPCDGMPDAILAHDVPDATQPLSLAFDGSGSSDCDGTIGAWSWNFGDGTPPTSGAQASHTYAAPGRYTVTLTVTDNSGNTSQSGRTLRVGPTQRVTAGLLHYYDFLDAGGSAVLDLGHAQNPLDLAIADSTNVSWPVCGGLVIDAATIIESSAPPTELIESVSTGGELTLEAWIVPSNTTQNGPARIVTVSDGAYDRNVTLGQEGTDFDVRFRTTNTGGNGANPSTLAGGVKSELTHVAYTRSSDGQGHLFIDGDLVATEAISGSTAGWATDFRLALANEFGADRAWMGEFHLLALYSRALGVAEVEQNFNAGFLNFCNTAPVAAIQASTITGAAPLAVDFSGSSSSDFDGDISTWSWVTSDGASGTSEDFAHVFQNAGTHSVTLTVTDDAGESDSHVLQIQVLPAGQTVRVTNGQIVYYPFTEATGQLVFDQAGQGAPLNLSITDPQSTSWLQCGGLSVDGDTLIHSAGPAQKIYDQITASHALTLEAWVKPDNLTQGPDSPARIITLSESAYLRNMTLGQKAGEYDVRLRTTQTGDNGLNPSTTTTGGVVETELTHIAYTHDAAGTARIYVNGSLAEERTIGGDLSNWNPTFRLALANELDYERVFLGDFHMAAVFSRALTASEVAQNFSAGIYENCNTPPVANPQELDTPEDQSLPITLTGSDADNDPLGFLVVDAPENGVLSGDAPHLIYTPSAGFNGEDSFTFIAQDATDSSAPAQITIDVLPVNNPPQAEPQSIEVDEDASLAIELTGSDQDGDTLSFSVVDEPTNGQLTGMPPNLVFTPAPDFHGEDAFTFLANDGVVDSDVATITVTVSPVNDPPSVVPVTGAIVSTENFVTTLSGADVDGDVLTYALVTAPGSGEAQIADDQLTYSPQSGFSGTVVFSYLANDGSVDSPSAAVTIEVTSVNGAPEIISAPLTNGSSDTAYVYDVDASDPDRDALSFALADGPAGMSIDSNTGLLSWQPQRTNGGSHYVAVLVSDPAGLSDQQSFLLNIVVPNQPPRITTTPNTTVMEDAAFIYDADAEDADLGDTLSWSLISAPDAATIDSVSGELSQETLDSSIVQGIRAVNDQCRVAPVIEGAFDPIVEWAWISDPEDPEIRHVGMAPVVVQLTDDNGDGQIDSLDVPDVVFAAGNRQSFNDADSTLLALSGDSGSMHWRSQEYDFAYLGSPAAGDLNGDGLAEIVVVNRRRKDISIFNHLGEELADERTANSIGIDAWDGPSIADLDGDGIPEIINAAVIHDSSGDRLWYGREDLGSNGAIGTGWPDPGAATVVADVDLDGFQEIVAGRTLYGHDDSVIWNRSDLDTGDGFNAVGNFDADDYAEIVLVGTRKVYLLDQDGSTIWGPYDLPGDPTLVYGGPPVVADFDNDGEPEIGVSGQITFQVIDTDGSLLWSRPMFAENSGVFGATAFDIDSDGRVEVIYQDEQYAYIVDGATGDAKLQIENPSVRGSQFPVIADIDNDGSAEILLSSSGDDAEYGLRVIGSASGRWAPARPLWNQYPYSIENIAGDGSIPSAPTPSWLTTNTYRQQSVLAPAPVERPDIAVFDVRYTSEQPSTVSVLMTNRGLSSADDIQVELYSGSPDANGVLLGVETLASLQAGDEATLYFNGLDANAINRNLVAIADPIDAISECIESNNTATGVFYSIRVEDTPGAGDNQAFTVSVGNQNEPPSILSANSAVARARVPFEWDVYASDPDQGDALGYALVGAPPRMNIDSATGKIRWLPTAADVGQHTFSIVTEDLGGLSVEQVFSLEVAMAAANQPPVFVSEPVRAVSEYLDYRYDSRAVDPDDGDVLSYSVTNSPASLQIDALGGGVSASALTTPVESDDSAQIQCVRARQDEENWAPLNNYALFHEQQGVHGGGPQTWEFKPDGMTVEVRGNAEPTVLVTDYEMRDNAVAVSVRAEGGDDDHIGFVWGWQDGQHYYRVRWNDQDTCPCLSVDLINSPEPLFEGRHDSNVNLYEGILKGYERFVDYTFYLDVQPGLAEIVLLEGDKVLDTIVVRDGTYTEGRFGFYNHSQANTFYRYQPIPREALADLRAGTVDLVSDNATDHVTANVLNRSPVTSIATTATLSAVHDDGQRNAVATVAVPSLDQGESVDIAFPAVPADGSIVRYEVLADSDHAQFECHENNNLASADVVTLAATDPSGLSGFQRYSVRVRNTNDRPVITSTPAPYATVGNAYWYSIGGEDIDVGDELRYELITGPEDMQFFGDTGLLVWVPGEDDLNEVYPVRVRVLDLYGAFNEQAFTLEVHRAPEIISEPVIVGRVGELYEYNVDAIDADGDAITYSITNYTTSQLSIDENTGVASFTPASGHVGFQAFVVRATDSRGAYDEQAFEVAILDIGEVNTPPAISSAPGVTAGRGSLYEYDLIATDPDGDALKYRLIEAPKAMIISDIAGEIDWVPAPTQFGDFPVTVEVSDRRGGIARQSFVITVGGNPSNNPPQITSSPIGGVALGETYRYAVIATDADNDSLTYALSQAPAGMSINASNGRIDWAPGISELGDHPVEIEVSDGQGGLVIQSYSVLVFDPAVVNAPPDILSTPLTTAEAGIEYTYAIEAEDANNDVLTTTITQLPPGAYLDAANVLRWTPETDGSEPFALSVSDGLATVTQSWTVNVQPALTPLQAQLSAAPGVVDIDEPVTISLAVADTAGTVNVLATLEGALIDLEANGQVQVTRGLEGIYTVEAVVSDATESVNVSASFEVRAGGATGGTAPVVQLQTPDYEQEVTAPIDVIGSVTDDNLSQWTLAALERDNPHAVPITLATGTNTFEEQVIAQFDPTLLLNGLYSIVLQAWDLDGNSVQDVRVVRVTDDMKIGHFSITFEDLTVPLAGMPITLTRTYDTRRRHEPLSFGQGWSLDYESVRVQESRRLGHGWSLIEFRMGFFSNWCVLPNGDPVVTVTLANGEVASFIAKADPECTFLVPENNVRIVLEAIDGTDHTLTQGDYSLLRLANGNIVDLGDPNLDPVDPDRYTLTSPEGYDFDLHQGFTLERVTDPVGRHIQFTEDGILHDSGESIDFLRDSLGRIIEVIAPDGTTLSYDYDAQGNLIAFTDQVGNLTQYTYLGDYYLEDIIDPRGIRVARNEYDSDGRLIAHVDAEGQRIEYSHDIEGRTEIIRDRRGHSSIYIYDDSGRVLSETNALGETTTRTHDADGYELTRTNPLGHTTTMTYDARGNVLTETNPEGETTSSVYSDRNQLLSQTDPAGIQTIQNLYFPDTGLLIQTEDALGNQTSFDYDIGIGSGATGNLKSIQDAQGHLTTYGYNGAGYRTRETNPQGTDTLSTYDDLGRELTRTTYRTDEDGNVRVLVTLMQYDEAGRLISTTDPTGATTTTEYNPIGKVAAQTDANGNRTEYEYDARGHQVLTRYPDGSTESQVYDEEGNLIESTDQAGRTTKMVYDAANRLTETIYPDQTPGDDSDNPRTRNEYDAAGRMTASIDERGNRTEYAYDDAGRRTLVRDALGRETSFEYDPRGLRTAMVDANGHRTEFSYDAAGRLTRTTFHDGTYTETAYDGLGRKVSETDQAGLTTQFEYDELGNLTAVIDALGQRTEYGYDEQSSQVSQTDAEGRTTTWAYDDAGRQTSRTLPLGQTEHFSYDPVGNRTARTDFNGETTTYGYDDLNRQTLRSSPDGTSVTMTYTLTGQVEDMTDYRGLTSYGYDERDRLTRIDYPTGQHVAYGYDEAGNRTQLITANQSVSYTFDELNRLETVTDANGTTTYAYDLVGNRAGMLNANGTSTTYEYDTLNRLTRVTHTDAFGQVFSEQVYTLGPSGQRERITEHTGRVVDYTYDDLYRLTVEQVTDPTLGDRVTSWAYDTVGNRLSQTETDGTGMVITTYSYDANDRLLDETDGSATTAYLYDANGNTLSKTVTDGQGTTQEAHSYTWDSENRLREANADGNLLAYQYDPQGIRQQGTVNGISTDYLIDPNRDYAQVLEEQGASPVLYTYGDDLISQTRSGQTHSYHYDGLGTTRALTDALGLSTDSYVYEAFGEIEDQTGATENQYLFTGEQFDPGLGYYYLRARYYDPTVGRFPSMDAWQGLKTTPQTLNKYLYTEASPTNGTDPSGHFTLRQLMAGLGAAARLLNVAIGSFSITDYLLGERRHSYDYSNRVCNDWEPGCNLENVYFGLRHYPAPVQNWRLGLGRPVDESGEELLLIFWSPVWTTGNGTNAIHNETLDGHIFYYGTVDRSVEKRGSSYYIRSYGEGRGNIAALNALGAVGIWWTMDQLVSDFVQESGGDAP